MPIPAGLYLPNHTVVVANVSHVAHLCMTVGSAFTLKLLRVTHQRDGVEDAGAGEASHTHFHTVLFVLFVLTAAVLGLTMSHFSSSCQINGLCLQMCVRTSHFQELRKRATISYADVSFR